MSRIPMEVSGTIARGGREGGLCTIRGRKHGTFEGGLVPRGSLELEARGFSGIEVAASNMCFPAHGQEEAMSHEPTPLLQPRDRSGCTPTQDKLRPEAPTTRLYSPQAAGAVSGSLKDQARGQ